MDSEHLTEAADKCTTKNTFTMDMIHSEDDVLHGLQHLIGYDHAGNSTALQGHETMVLYRNIRKKYSSTPDKIKDYGLHCVSTFRTPEKGLETAYRSALCRQGPEREASALYVSINPRSVLQGMALTQTNCTTWMESKVGLTKEQVKGMHREDYIGTMDKQFIRNILKSQSRRRVDMIDVDDRTWLPRIRKAIGDENIEMIVETKNGYHVIYHGKQLIEQQHKQLQKILSESPKGALEKASRCKGSTVVCALPGGSQSYHKSKIIYCACHRKSPPPKLSTNTKSNHDNNIPAQCVNPSLSSLERDQ